MNKLAMDLKDAFVLNELYVDIELKGQLHKGSGLIKKAVLGITAN